MTMGQDIRAEVAGTLGSEVVQVESLSGGDINLAYAVGLDDGREVFVKTNAAADPRMFGCEARGLAWLGDAGALRTPTVLAVSETLLVLELLVPGARAEDYDEQLGRGLARLHAHGAPSFGLDENNFLATLDQDNTCGESWPDFYSHRRLEPLVRRAVDHGDAPSSWVSRFAALFTAMPNRVGPAEPPARLHGDLWSGNLHADAAGLPVLIDPAVYGGHREVDLAMLRLFGSPSERFFTAYDEVEPRAPGSGERVELYQLYPLLAHVNLFGGSYLRSVEGALASCL